MNNKIITILSFLLLFLLVTTVKAGDSYYCEARELFSECESFSTYYGLENGKCINSISGNKLCSSGWKKESIIVKEESIDIPKQETGINYYVELIKEQGVTTIVLAFTFWAIFGLLSFGQKYLNFVIDKKFKRKQFNLANHPVHKKIDYWLKFDISDLQIKNDFRRELVSDFLNIKFEVWKKHLNSLALIHNIEKLSLEELENKILEDLERAVEEYNNKCENYGIPLVFIKKFNDWHEPRVKDMYDWISHVCHSNFYINNKHKIGAIFDKYQDALNGTVVDAEITLQDINGDMKGQIYKGMICKK